MNTKHKLSLITLLAAATAFPALAAADHPTSQRIKIGDVGTHRHDAEDFIQVSSRQRFDRIELRAHGRPVAVDAVQIKFADGTSRYASVHGYVTPGRGLVIDVPAHRAPIKMLVLDYGNRGPFWRAREDARVEVFGITSRYDRYDRSRDGYEYRRGYGTSPGAPVYQGYDEGSYYRDYRDQDDGVRWEWRGGVRVRIR